MSNDMIEMLMMKERKAAVLEERIRVLRKMIEEEDLESARCTVRSFNPDEDDKNSLKIHGIITTRRLKKIFCIPDTAEAVRMLNEKRKEYGMELLPEPDVKVIGEYEDLTKGGAE